MGDINLFHVFLSIEISLALATRHFPYPLAKKASKVYASTQVVFKDPTLTL